MLRQVPQKTFLLRLLKGVFIRWMPLVSPKQLTENKMSLDDV